MPITIEIDKSLCVGSGDCERIAPDTFRVGDDGQVELLVTPVPDGDLVRSAVSACPTGALRVVAEQ
jgi:ferredoxin